MDQQRKVIVGLPAYNEENGLPKLLTKLINVKSQISSPFSILVINDGSSDGTEDILKNYAKQYPFINYLNHETNKGLGQAMKTMFEHTVETFNDNDLLITLDSDNTHNPAIIPELIKKIDDENLDVVIASRFTKGGKEIGLSAVRKIYSRGAKVFLKTFYPIPFVNDYSCGYRAYRVGYLKKASTIYDGKLITTNGFECMVEILARFSKIGVHAGEFPLRLEYHLKEGQSKLPVVRTIIGYFSLLKKVRKPTYQK